MPAGPHRPGGGAPAAGEPGVQSRRHHRRRQRHPGRHRQHSWQPTGPAPPGAALRLSCSAAPLRGAASCSARVHLGCRSEAFAQRTTRNATRRCDRQVTQRTNETGRWARSEGMGEGCLGRKLPPDSAIWHSSARLWLIWSGSATPHSPATLRRGCYPWVPGNSRGCRPHAVPMHTLTIPLLAVVFALCCPAGADVLVDVPPVEAVQVVGCRAAAVDYLRTQAACAGSDGRRWSVPATGGMPPVVFSPARRMPPAWRRC